MPANKFTISIGLILMVVFFGIFFTLQDTNSSATPANQDALGVLPTVTGSSLLQAPDTATNPSPTTAAVPQNIPGPEATAAQMAVITTSKGDITIEFYKEDAPKTVANFIQKANSKFYNNLTFHRVEDWVIQGGDPVGNGTGGGNMPVEFNDKPFVTGSVGVASRGDGKVQNDSQFFITKSDATWLNNQYTNFGIVTEGMDVVDSMAIGDKILQITLK